MTAPINENDSFNDNTSFHDEAPSDRGMNKVIQNAREHGIEKGQEKLAKGVTADADIDEDTGEIYSQNLMDEDDFTGEEDFLDDTDFDNDEDFVTKH